MATVEATSRRIRAAAVSHTPDQRHGANEFRRPQTRLENACEVGRTMLILGLIAVGIVALRYVLVIAYGWFY
ncbi:MAG: hypothetical protein JO081_06775 [Alphaproteobacteria bacterium]|nr:hypothetical protein [Alphaproteobacteria bacterium]